MRALKLVLGVVLAAFSSACTSDETAICERLDECNFLAPGTSVEDCEDEAEDADDPSDCRECVEDHDCNEILQECANDCED
jgi:hypothetical protein